MDLPQMLTIDEASKRCKELDIGIAKNHIRQLCKNNTIPCAKIGVKTLLNWGGLLEYLNGDRMQ